MRQYQERKIQPLQNPQPMSRELNQSEKIMALEKQLDAGPLRKRWKKNNRADVRYREKAKYRENLLPHPLWVRRKKESKF